MFIRMKSKITLSKTCEHCPVAFKGRRAKRKGRGAPWLGAACGASPPSPVSQVPAGRIPAHPSFSSAQFLPPQQARVSAKPRFGMCALTDGLLAEVTEL